MPQSIHKITKDDPEKRGDGTGFCRGLSFVAISRARAITDIAFLNRIGEQRLKKLGGQNRVAVDLRRRQQLPFHDEDSAEELGYRFND